VLAVKDPIEPVEEHDPPVQSLVAIIVNRGRYTITRVEAQFWLVTGSAGSLVSHRRMELLTGYADLDEKLREDLSGPQEYNIYLDRLAPWDIGIRVVSDPMAVKFTRGSYPVVRWTDRWGTRWEHRRGQVRQIDDSAQWAS
jgi:hypothetical protein